jgi:hypothetical protein
MRRSLLFAIACAAVLLAPSTASAKEISGVSVCAADGCREVTDEQLWPALVEGGPGTNAPAGPLEHYTVHVRVLAEEEETVEWSYVAVPSRGLMQGEDGSWMTMTPANRKALLALTQGRVPLEPGQMPPGKDLPTARVDEVYSPAATTEAAAADDSSPWPWLAGIGLGAVVIGLVVAYRRAGGDLGRRARDRAGAAGHGGGRLA